MAKANFSSSPLPRWQAVEKMEKDAEADSCAEVPVPKAAEAPEVVGGRMRKVSFHAKRELPAMGEPKAEDGAAPAAAVGPCFYAVCHKFGDDAEAVEAWWGALSGTMPADMAALTKKNNSLGFHNHAFMPAAKDGMDDMDGTDVYCIWECKQETSPEAFQCFVDGPDGPWPGVFASTCYKAMAGLSLLPVSRWSDSFSADAKGGTGSMFWVRHELEEDEMNISMCEVFGDGSHEDGAWLAPLSEQVAKNNSLGFHNHSFILPDPFGPVFCVWESKKPMEIAEFKVFVNGRDGPNMGQLRNSVHKSMPGSFPCAKFAAKDTKQVRAHSAFALSVNRLGREFPHCARKLRVSA